jgi:superfamily I DNA/RNA helicase
VIVDEAQDLDPSVLRMLVELCRAPNRLFITADANQSIYGSSFRWSEVHERLQFRGRSGVLRANFRSTREIGEAAQSFLADGALDEEQAEREYRHEGPLPAVRAVRGGGDECALLARFLPVAARDVRLGLGACAILCPTEKSGKAIAATLVSKGLDATFMAGKDLDLGRKGIKLLTLKSAKGLEFPVVALAGFPPMYPPLRTDMSVEQREEVLVRERRALFVGMTRAMRALLVIVPEGTSSALLTGFNPTWWNMGEPGAAV